jgi:hypothetical protein
VQTVLSHCSHVDGTTAPAGHTVLTALTDAVCVLRLHCLLHAARQPSPAGAQPSISGGTAALPAASGADNGLPPRQPRPQCLWSVASSASVHLRSCSLAEAELTIQSADDAGSVAHAHHGDSSPVPGLLQLRVRWRSGGPSDAGSRLPRCQLQSEPPVLPAYLRSLEAMADGGSEVCPAGRPAPRPVSQHDSLACGCGSCCVWQSNGEAEGKLR